MRRHHWALLIGGAAVGPAVLLALFASGAEAPSVDVRVTVEAPAADFSDCADGPVCDHSAAPLAVAQPTLVVTPPPVSSPPPVKLSPPAQTKSDDDDDATDWQPLPTPASALSIRVDGTGYDAVRADGFPAMSADGKRLAIASVEDDGGRGNPNLRIVVKSALTGATVKSFPILAVDEVTDANDPPRLPKQSKLEARRAKAMRYLSKGHFKPAVELRSQMRPAIEDDEAEQYFVGPYRVRLEGELFQVFDKDSGWLHAQKSLAAPPSATAPTTAVTDPDSADFDPCAGTSLAYVNSWLSRGHDHLILELVSQAGPCYCDSEFDYVVVPMRKNSSE